MYTLFFPQLNEETDVHWLALKVQQHCEEHYKNWFEETIKKVW